MIILLKIIMNEIYGYEFTYYLPICYSGFAMSALILPLIIGKLVNPSNLRPNVKYIEN